MKTLERSSSFSPLFTRLLNQRGLSDPAEVEKFLAAELGSLTDPYQMKGMREAVLRIHKAVMACQKILIHGDYDVDGITGTAIVSRALEAVRAEYTTFLPERIEDGYGVSGRAIRAAGEKGVKLLMTVDCGITALDQIALARSLGMDVIVIDHHEISPRGFPNATVILNPFQADCPYPFKGLTAGGLAFKLAQALLGEEALALLDLAALSTVCDVAPLVGENRVIVKHGLEKIAHRQSCGIRALIEAAQVKSREINTGHVGFMLGPRINAAGRMSSPDIALRLLVSNHPVETASLARVLEEENRMRQKEERRVVQEAVQEVERTFHFNRDRVIVVGRDNWHPGVIGIVASRLVDKYHRPAFVISLSEKTGKGSGRSIKHFHLLKALEAAAEHLEEFGGHEQAAGLVIRPDKIKDFRETVNRHASESYGLEIFQKDSSYDLEIGFSDLNLNFWEELKLLEPHGAGNPRPVFLTRGLEVKRWEPIPKINKIRLWITDGHSMFEGNLQADGPFPAGQSGFNQKMDLFYSLRMKEWEGTRNLILDVKEVKPQL